jgi:hypothetical protein
MGQLQPVNVCCKRVNAEPINVHDIEWKSQKLSFQFPRLFLNAKPGPANYAATTRAINL